MASTPALRIHNLSKSFGGVAAVDNLSLEVNDGEIFALLGPNGAGKSTTINMVSGVCRIDRGQVEVFGFDNQRDYRRTRWLTGVMHQEVVIDHFFTIDRALAIHAGYYGMRDDRRWRDQLIERLGLGPHLKKPMIQLSGGLKRRFMVAKALIHQPRLLILDEPTAGVDVELRHSLWDFVREINQKGVTVLLTTHYLEEAESMCDRIAIMNHGKLVALERKHDMLQRCGRHQIRLTLTTPQTALPDFLNADSAQMEEEGQVLTLTVAGDQNPADLLQSVLANGLRFSAIETRQPDLEEVFIELTGLGKTAEATLP